MIACHSEVEEFTEKDAAGQIIAQGNLVNGQRSGKWIFFHSNGVKKHQTNYIAGTEHGAFSFWDSQGNLSMQGHQDSGKFVWVEEFYPNGNYSSAISYHPPGIKNDTLKTWYENGQIQLLGKYHEDQKTGIWRQYLDNGRLFLMEHYYRDSLLKKEQNFDANFIQMGADKVKLYTARQSLTYYTDTLADIQLDVLDQNGNVIQKKLIQFKVRASENYLSRLHIDQKEHRLTFIDDFMIKGPTKDYKILKFANDHYTLFFNEYYGIISLIDRKKEQIYQLNEVGPGMIYCYQEPISLFYESDFYVK